MELKLFAEVVNLSRLNGSRTFCKFKKFYSDIKWKHQKWKCWY